MKSFLEEVVEEIGHEYGSFEDLIFVLPSKRAGTFLKNALAKSSDKTFFAPDILSIERFIEKISGLAYATQTQQLFFLYEIYLKSKPAEQDNFYTFSKWGQTLLQDINEIDRYLIDAEKLFASLSAIQELDHWSLRAEKTTMMEDYLQFWNNLESLYHNFNGALLEKGLGHQGLVYRTACQKLEGFLAEHSEKTFIFLGFNALNTAESEIIQHILHNCSSEIYWDIDSYFLQDNVHDAGYFIRQHLKTWPYLTKNGLKGKSENYSTKKYIKIVGVPKNVSQAKYTGQLLHDLHLEDSERLRKTAVVLGDETLLNPLLNSVPPEIERVNITMGYPLVKTSLAAFFDKFIALYLQRNTQGWFYRDLLEFLAQPSVNSLLNVGKTNIVGTIEEAIKTKNWTYINVSELVGISRQHTDSIELLFFENTPTPKEFTTIVLKIIAELKTRPQSAENPLALEYLYRFYELFNQLDELIKAYDFIKDLKSLQSLYRELLSSETLDFQGEPLEGLQIMGMLESRNLDFETVIITSVNEGILPSGKSNNSFIPFDLKIYSNLPTYKEKDAVYTYHFYRLLQRAKHVYILYSTEPDDGLGGGERSRLINQLLTDENKLSDIVETYASPTIFPTLRTLEHIAKDTGLMDLIKSHAAQGFSPTSLSNYIRNPIDFYRRNLLGIDNVMEVEETVAANTFGTIVHDTLEDLYRPFIGEYLTENVLQTAKGNIKGLVKHHFLKSYGDGDISRGKNLIAFHVAMRYIENFIALEIEDVKQHRIKLIGLEKKLQVELDVPELNFPIHIKGKLDRIDEMDGTLRIIDYKTGRVTSTQVEIVDWDEITSNYDYSKAFQLLCYAFMYQKEAPGSTVEAGIISFKNLNAGLMRFATKPKKGSRAKDSAITQQTLSHFAHKLHNLILEICNRDIPFIEKEV
ncbi:PD-(D/E)XK nuclease superfamily protein [Pricia antarctica]|uniref:PD-(D/E)XK nuclease superfamily protein n=1 Tax=Pricia antarctica TaxID=641691 RepID=A0A1G6WT47_9FLAO|nr:PD-(D/E)XK nuclease family protein [Pricia antarctica]SDD68991.1 PD-(D/E)XK nuclease superfamily protein [Pricia antarctica]